MISHLSRLVTLIKRLVYSGDAISRVANVDNDVLAERAKDAPLPEIAAERAAACRVAVLGDALTRRLGRECGGRWPGGRGVLSRQTRSI